MSTNISANLSDETLKRLAHLAAESGMTPDELIQLAVDQWLTKWNQGQVNEIQQHCNSEKQ